jgi:acyl-coenzyme A thioesterase PaaI-like protein
MTPESGPIPVGGKPWSGHGREELADAVRRLIELTVTSSAPPHLLADAAARATALADELEHHVPEPGPVPTARFADDSVHADQAEQLGAAMPFDVVIGTCNPLAIPLSIEFDPPKAIGHATFTAPYEGAPGCVHGAALAGAFDLVLTAANVITGAAGPTVTLSVRYLHPTVIDRPARFEGWVSSIEGRRIHSRGQLIQAGVVTVEAVGEFSTMGRSGLASMHRRGGGR